MRRSNIWFLIACLWLIDVFINIARGHGRQAWLPTAVTAAFFLTGIIHRSREAKPAVRKPLK